MFKNRSTVDVVVILLAAMVSFTIFAAAIGTIVGKMMYPNMDVARGAEAIENTVTTIVGALVGFIGGRAVGKNESNGMK